ncbi:MAG: glycosyltransferase family 2 protein [Bdellovibrionales bacterium]|nr:glycosyltransferase family 2 protein [Bdellovibrionales bacterium]
MPQISLLIPCYNAAPYLPRLCENIAALTTPFDEILFYDDGSTDETLQVANSFGIDIFRAEENHGPGYARNRLAERAKADWIHFHDADDLMHPDFVSTMLAPTNEEADVLLCHAEWLDEEHRGRQVHWRYDSHVLKTNPLESLLCHPSSALNAVYRKETFLRVGGFREDIHCWEDADLNVRLAHAGASFLVVDETLVTALRHGRGASAQRAMCLECRMKLLREYGSLFGEKYNFILGQEGEKVAREYLSLDDTEGVLSALHLCCEFGYQIPHTKNFLLKALGRFLPPLWSFSLQESVRKLNSRYSCTFQK